MKACIVSPLPVQASRALVYRQCRLLRQVNAFSFLLENEHKVRLYMGTVADATSYANAPMYT